MMTGTLGGNWKVRAERIQGLMAILFPHPPGAGPPEKTRSPERHTVRRVAGSALRSEAASAATTFLHAVLKRDLDRVGQGLSQEVQLLWGDGCFVRMPRHELLSDLDRGGGSSVRGGEARNGEVHDVRVYSLAELRNATARGVGSSLNALLDLESALVTTAHVSVGGKDFGRVFVVVELDEPGPCRMRTLPLPGIDEAHVRGHGLSASPDEASTIVERFVRHVVLGHSAQLASLAPMLMPRVWLDDGVVEAQEILRRSAVPPHRLDKADRVFGRTAKIAATAAKEAVGIDRWREMERRSIEVWGKRIDRFVRTEFETIMTSLNSVSGTLENEQRAFTLLLKPSLPSVGLGDASHRPSGWRVGAILGAK